MWSHAVAACDRVLAGSDRFTVIATALHWPTHAGGAPGALLGLLGAERVPYTVCSPFAALSGKGDAFTSIDDLVGPSFALGASVCVVL